MAKNCTKVEEKWCEIFEYMVNQNIGLQNISGIIEYALAIPGTNAAVERTFSNINILWSDEKNRFLIDTIKAIIIVKNHFKNYSCKEFYNFLLTQNELLSLINLSHKYDFGSKKELQSTSE